MKRSSQFALILGGITSALVIAAHASGILQPIEDAMQNALMGSEPPARSVGPVLQSALVSLLSLGVAWLVVTSSQKKRVSWAVGILALEILVLTWIGLFSKTFFQPLPALLAAGLALAGGHAYPAIMGRRKPSDAGGDFFVGRLAPEQIARITSGEVAFQAKPESYEATAVVCDIANKHDIADECPPAEVAEITDKFMRHATESFLKAGAYLETVTGEGIVAVFGFPAGDPQQADKATRHALSLLESFDKLKDGSKDECYKKFSVHVGISSGPIIIVPREQEERAGFFATGEPVELARRFCIANRVYGSRILIGPRTFELASKGIVARPIDFMSGVDARERHEIYEPLKLATEASPDEIARRDFFWNGVVLYREKRWAEAYSQFQKARGPNEQNDVPLQLYVRRLEPLVLHLSESPLE
ncbi:MAG: adenylate/guanylate cyclase domain-containing protein [Chthoniobacterales bacterium]|nr:adenylate/guanylate cyclase domain-containing protein [Chthoniobacterales bacterium]